MGKQWKRIDMTGQKFGRLTVVEFAGIGRENRAMWNCKCDCGKTIVVSGKSLRNGNTNSCGCLSIENATKRIVLYNTKHGCTHTRLYRIWAAMKNRCNNSKGYAYNRYGNRGIKVCEEWQTFQQFYEWAMQNGYKYGLSIDRIDNDGDYCPENCRWATAKQQDNNRSSNKIVEYNGEKHTISEWADILGMHQDTLGQRLKSKNYSLEKAMTEPVRKRRKLR